MLFGALPLEQQLPCKCGLAPGSADQPQRVDVVTHGISLLPRQAAQTLARTCQTPQNYRQETRDENNTRRQDISTRFNCGRPPVCYYHFSLEVPLTHNAARIYTQLHTYRQNRNPDIPGATQLYPDIPNEARREPEIAIETQRDKEAHSDHATSKYTPRENAQRETHIATERHLA